MAIDIAFSASVDLNESAKSLKSLKQEFKETQKELDGLTAGSEKYVNTLKKLGGIKDEIGDLNAEINAFNPEGKVQAFGNVVSGLASGFQAAAGAAALFGDENKEIEKQLVKLQAVMAFTDGIKGIVALGDSFKALSLTMKATALGQKAVAAAQWLINAAMSANPIGLIIAGLTALVGVMALYVNSVDDAAESQKRLNALQEEHKKVINEEVEAIRRLQAINDKQFTTELELARAKGASIQEIRDLEKKAINDKLKELAYVEGYRGKLDAKELQEKTALTNQLALIDAKYTKHLQDEADKRANKNKEENEKRIRENGLAFLKEIEEKERIENERIAKEEADAIAVRDRLQKEHEQKIADEKYILEQKLIAFDAISKAIDDENAKKEKAALEDRQRVDATIEIAKASAQSLQSLSDLYFEIKKANTQKGSAEELKAAKQQFKINKALAIQSATISGIQGVINALSAQSVIPEPFGTVLKAATAVSVGVAAATNIAKIASTQFSENGTGGGGSASVPSAPSAPSINAPTNTSTQLNEDGTVRKAEAPAPNMVKAYVVETDITKSQKNVATIEKQAEFG